MYIEYDLHVSQIPFPKFFSLIIEQAHELRKLSHSIPTDFFKFIQISIQTQNHIIFSLDNAKLTTSYFFKKNVLKIE